MMLSKLVKRITSIGLAAAMVVSGFTYQPAKAEAAELPVVTVLGATLSLDAEAGKQSMRVAIKVENADNASACGMKITYNGKTLPFSTNDGKNNKLYDYDEETNTVVYAVKIANIPSANFADNFTIEGFATPITDGTGEDVTTAAPVEKSVNGVVEAIKEATGNDNITLVNGELVQVEDGFDVDLSGVANYYDVESGKLVGNRIADQMVIKLNEAIPGGASFELTVNGSIEGDAILRAFPSNEWGNGKFASAPNVHGQNCSIDFDNAYEYVTSDMADYFTFKMPGDDAATFEITKITVSNIRQKITASDVGDTKLIKNIDVILSADTAMNSGGPYYFFDPANNVYNNDGSVTFSLYTVGNESWNMVNSFYFNANKTGVDLNNYSRVEIVASANEPGVGVRCSVVKNSSLNVEIESDCINMTGAKIQDSDTTITIPLNNVTTRTTGFGVSMQHTTWDTIASKSPVITIKSIRLIK